MDDYRKKVALVGGGEGVSRVFRRHHPIVRGRRCGIGDAPRGAGLHRAA